MSAQTCPAAPVVSRAFRRCQQILTTWLEDRPGMPPSLVDARRTLVSLPDNEWAGLMRWLEWRLYAARCNGSEAEAGRTQRLVASLRDKRASAATPGPRATHATASIRHALPRSA